eukprot:COSAG04_NODE_4362_length_2137_cov_1.555937_2_plen_498_part_01
MAALAERKALTVSGWSGTWTPLDRAATCTQPQGAAADGTRLLLAAGADATAESRNGNTALHIAAVHGPDDPVLAGVLVGAGCDPAAKANKKRMTALDLAKQHNKPQVVALLEAMAADLEATLAPFVAEVAALRQQGMSFVADTLGRADQALPKGTRICVAGFGRGTYLSFARKLIGANQHTITFDSGETVAVKLQGDVGWAVESAEEWTVKESEMDTMDPRSVNPYRRGTGMGPLSWNGFTEPEPEPEPEPEEPEEPEPDEPEPEPKHAETFEPEPEPPAVLTVHLSSKMDGFDAIPALTLGPQTTILELKHQCVTYMKVRLHSQVNLHAPPGELAEQMELRLAGQPALDDGLTLADSAVESGDTLWMTMRLRGGGGGPTEPQGAYVSAFAPAEIEPNDNAFVLDISVFQRAQETRVVEHARQLGKAEMGSKQLRLRHDAQVTVTVELPTDAFKVEDDNDFIYWDRESERDSAQFQVVCLRAAELRKHACKALIDIDG